MTMVLSAALLISLSSVIGIRCQTVQIDPNVNFTTKCPEGTLIEDLDSYWFSGKVGPVSKIGYFTKAWAGFVILEARSQDNSTFSQICQINIADANSCKEQPKEDCYCSYFGQENAHFVVKLKAKAANSNSMLRVVWHRVDKSESVAGNVTLPRIYDLSEAGVTVNGKLLTSPSNICQLSLVSTKGSAKLKLCCDSSSTPNPCLPEVVVDKVFFNGSGGSCVNIALNKTYQGKLSYSLTICDRIEAKKGFCTINLQDGGATNTPANDDPTGNDKNSGLHDMDVAFAGLSISAIIIPVCLAVCLCCCLYRKCKKKQQSVDQMGEKRNSISSVTSGATSVTMKESKESAMTDGTFTEFTERTSDIPTHRPLYTPLPKLDEEPSINLDESAS